MDELEEEKGFETESAPADPPIPPGGGGK